MTDDNSERGTGVEWPTDATLYKLKGKIGSGAFATVWKATTSVSIVVEDAPAEKKNAQRQEECAIKVLNLDHVDSNLSEIRLEVQAMRLSSHPNVLACHAAFVHNTDLWLVTQLMRKGSSLHCLQGARKRIRQQQQKKGGGDTCPPPQMEDYIMYIVHETLLGLKYIHENGQIHRDIKAGNILLDSNGDVRIADFGVSGWLVNAGSQQERAKTFVGTPCWMAPEVMEQIHGYDYKADIWSLGITALELAKGYAPYAKYPPMRVLILTIQEEPPSLDTYDEEDGGDEYDDLLDYTDEEEYSRSFRAFVDSCLQKNPAKRPTCADLLQSKPLSAFQDPTFRDDRRRAIVEQVCNLVEDVGTLSPDEAPNRRKDSLPGNIPISILTEKNRPAGTTWVFADGSQVLSAAATAANTVDDVMDEIDQFGLQTGGEHYTRDQNQLQQQSDPSSTQQPQRYHDKKDAEPDDLNAFMDEFELSTQGEDFRRPARESG